MRPGPEAAKRVAISPASLVARETDRRPKAEALIWNYSVQVRQTRVDCRTNRYRQHQMGGIEKCEAASIITEDSPPARIAVRRSTPESKAKDPMILVC